MKFGDTVIESSLSFNARLVCFADALFFSGAAESTFATG